MTHMDIEVSERLSHAYAQWQDTFMLFDYATSHPAERAWVTSRHRELASCGYRLAQTILDNHVQELRTNDWSVGSDLLFGKIEALEPYFRCYRTFPLELFKWNRKSRRIFHLPHSLEATLASATFLDITWDDILWPHESFIVTIEKPLVIKNQHGISERFDTIMVTRTPDHKTGEATVNLRWFMAPPKAGVKLEYTQREQRQFQQVLKSKNFGRAKVIWKKRSKRISKLYKNVVSQACEFTYKINGEEKIPFEPAEVFHSLEMNDQLKWEKQDDTSMRFFEAISVSLRIVVGWMMYLERIGSRSSLWEMTEERAARSTRGRPLGIITEPEHIFKIIGRGRLDPSKFTESYNNGNGQGFIRPHWRRAHYKRPWGSSLDAPKSVRIPPILVREDLIPLYGIIGGTKTIVLEAA